MSEIESVSELEDSLSPGAPNIVFIVTAVCLFSITNLFTMDDPGLGWHLRYADRMWETGGFLHTEEFSSPSLGKPLKTYAWFGDIVMRLCHAWAGMNGIGVLTALTFALMGRILLARMIREQIPWMWALFWTFFAFVAIMPSFTARPNMFTFVGLAITVAVCERFHSGAISRKQTLWLLPLFLCWTNAHSGFLSGTLVLVVTYFSECMLSVFGSAESCQAARKRVAWWTGLGTALFLTTLVNPYGIGLYTHLLSVMSDPSVQRASTTEWMPPDFSDKGWYFLEAMVLLLPLLAVVSRRKPSIVTLAICLVFLHFALTGRRYTTLWCMIAAPTLASMSCATPWFVSIQKRIAQFTSSKFRAKFINGPHLATPIPSILFAIVFLFGSRWLPPVSGHNPHKMPVMALNKLLEIQHGERVFHSANWGGYLTWNGWDLKPRFLTWIDDRNDVYGSEHLSDYRSIISAAAGWEDKLDGHRIDILCLPLEAALVEYVRRDTRWKEIYADEMAVIFRRKEPYADSIKSDKKQLPD